MHSSRWFVFIPKVQKYGFPKMFKIQKQQMHTWLQTIRYHCRSQTGYEISTSSAKSSDAILSPPNWKPSPPWLCLDVLFMKIINRIVTEQSQHSLDTGPICWREPEHSSYSTLSIDRLDGPGEWPHHPLLPQYLPQKILGDRIIHVLQIHKTHVYWMDIFSSHLQNSQKSKKLSFHNQDKINIVPLQSDIQHSASPGTITILWWRGFLSL